MLTSRNYFPTISPYAAKRLAENLRKIRGLRAAYLYPVFDGYQYVLVGIAEDFEICELFNAACQYSSKRHPPVTKSFTSEQLRVYEFQLLVDGFADWLKSLNLPIDHPPLLHDAVLLPEDWENRCLELQSLYHSNTMGFLSKLIDRPRTIIFEP
ncbi:hypothetical protein A2929_02185 [Candidatus Kaiserbacteria bacterium RIFCSPLOWO2_01_FULL_45_25]|nr:MAG: hypothetical protein A2929_02185 [Candidatus Kaiserbacteria bacterium RIFCSPLOWO2_01_FULL_45_25]